MEIFQNYDTTDELFDIELPEVFQKISMQCLKKISSKAGVESMSADTYEMLKKSMYLKIKKKCEKLNILLSQRGGKMISVIDLIFLFKLENINLL